MKRILTIAFAFAIALGGAAATNADPGPHHGNNQKGLCTAYFNGQKNGHEDGSPPPFAALEEAADDEDNGGDGDGTGTPEEVAAFCDGLVGGNPDHGRYPGCFDGDQDGDGDNCDDTAPAA